VNFGNQKNFKPAGEALDPLIKGREEYLDFYGRISNDRDWWKKATFVSLISTLIMTVGMVYISTSTEFIPFMLIKDAQTGYVQAMGPVTEVKYDPGEAEITYFIGDLIQKVRSIPLDPVVYNANWTAAKAFLSPSAMQKMNAMAEEEGQRLLLGKITIQPTIVSIQPLANAKNTYQVRWTEEAFSFNGSSKKTTTIFNGTFTISIKSPKTKAAYYTNPIGLIVEDFSLTKEKETNANTSQGGGHK